MGKTIIGIDQSLTGTGVCNLQIANRDNEEELYSCVKIKTSSMRGVERLRYIIETIRQIIKTNTPCLAVMEGYSM